MRIGFAITGAGHLLNESVQVAEKLSKNHDVTIFLSAASEEVDTGNWLLIQIRSSVTLLLEDYL